MFPICQSDQSLKDSHSLFSIETKHLLNSKYSLSCLTDNMHLYFSIVIILEIGWLSAEWTLVPGILKVIEWLSTEDLAAQTPTDSGENMCQGWISFHFCDHESHQIFARVYNPKVTYPGLWLKPHLLLYKITFQCWSRSINLNFLTLRLWQLCAVLLFGLHNTGLKAGSLFQQCWNKELQWCYTAEIKNAGA